MQGGGLKLEASPYEDDLTSHPRHIPDTANLAEQFQACLQVQLHQSPTPFPLLYQGQTIQMLLAD